jgi:hypothetical protein
MNYKAPDKNLLLIFANFWLLATLGLGIICYDGDFSDTNEDVIDAFLYPSFLFGINDHVIFLKFNIESIRLFSIDKIILLTRAPPVHSSKV